MLVGPSTAMRREVSPRGEWSFMGVKMEDASARRGPPRGSSSVIAWMTPAADASKIQITTNDAAVKKRVAGGGGGIDGRADGVISIMSIYHG